MDFRVNHFCVVLTALATSAPTAAHAQRVLLVESDPLVASVLAPVLTADGMTVTRLAVRDVDWTPSVTDLTAYDVVVHAPAPGRESDAWTPAAARAVAFWVGCGGGLVMTGESARQAQNQVTPLRSLFVIASSGSLQSSASRTYSLAGTPLGADPITLGRTFPIVTTHQRYETNMLAAGASGIVVSDDNVHTFAIRNVDAGRVGQTILPWSALSGSPELRHLFIRMVRWAGRSKRTVTTNDVVRTASPGVATTFTVSASNSGTGSIRWAMRPRFSTSWTDAIPPSLTFNDSYAYFSNTAEVYAANDTDSDVGQVAVNVSGTAVAPESSTTTRDGAEDESILIPIMLVDRGGASVTRTTAVAPAHGTLNAYNAACLRYQPVANYAGSDSVTLRYVNPAGLVGNQTWTLAIAPVDDAPVPADGTFSTDWASRVDVTLAATDIDSTLLTYEILTPPAHGQLLGTPPALTYYPDVGFEGQVTVTFRVRDAVNTSAPGTIRINLTRPLSVDATPQSVLVDEDTPTTITLAGTTSSGRTLSYEVTTPLPAGTGTLSGSGATRTYVPPPEWSGDTSFQFRACDGAICSQPVLVAITVRPIDDPPVSAPQTIALAGGATVPVTLAGSDIDDPASSLQYEIVTPPAHGTLSGTAPALQYTAANAYAGPDAFTYRVRDPAGRTSATATIGVTITFDFPPVADARVLDLDEDTSVAFVLTGSDPESAPIAFELVTTPTTGTLSGDLPSFTYTARPNFAGTDTLTFRVTDGLSWSSAATVTFIVHNVNDPPTVRGPDAVTTDEDTTVSVTVSVSDIDSSVISLVFERFPTRGTIGSVVGRTFDYLPTRHLNGDDLIIVRASDGQATSAPFAITIHVTPQPDPPAAIAQARTTAEDVPFDVQLAGTDPDGDALTFRIESPPAHGTLTGPMPTPRYVPAPDFNGTDAFTFTSSDGTTRSPPATVSITVTPVDDAPFARDFTVRVDEDRSVELSFQAGDPDGQPVTLTVDPPSIGTVTRLSNGSYRYAPPPDFNGTATVGFRAASANLVSATARCTIEVTPVNDAPVIAAAPPSLVTLTDGTAYAFPLSATDVDDTRLTWTATGLPARATLGASSGAFAWTPDYSQVGPCDMTFTVRDPAGLTASRAVSFVVSAADSDVDGVPDAVERRLGTNPSDRDSDHDGLDDRTELGPGDLGLDSDRDGIPDAIDTDSDDDRVPDADELGPDGTRVDSDDDGFTDDHDSDSDDDGLPDATDVCRTVADPEQRDLDRDGTGDLCDDDRDGDGVSNSKEIAWYSNPDAKDTDGDTILDPDELYGGERTPSDADRDGQPDAMEADADADGHPDAEEAGDDDPATKPVDSDADGTADFRDPDSDDDGVPDKTDDCRLVTNPLQEDLDQDGTGDACSGDKDGDGVPNRADVCPGIADPDQFDTDADGTGDACSDDDDADGHPDAADTCPLTPDPDQRDSDQDGQGDACDPAFDATFSGGCDAAAASWLALLVLPRRRRRTP